MADKQSKRVVKKTVVKNAPKKTATKPSTQKTSVKPKKVSASTVVAKKKADTKLAGLKKIYSKLRTMRRTVKIHGVYRHHKGMYYIVENVAEHTETGEKLVIYRALYGGGRVWARPYDMFLSKVDRKKYPEAKQKWRFEKIKEVKDGD